MKSISKLKDDARKHEQKEEWEKAIQVYRQVLEVSEEGETEVELPLYNRIGDLCVRLGRPKEAVGYYEQAADRYAEAGLFNNAIALCNKALRYDPDQLPLMRKLGQFSASQGFITDARRYFLDYAERQFKAGEVDDALSALEDFANVSDDAEVRELLGRRLHAHGRTAEAVTELTRARALRQRAGETEEADALATEIAGMDPDASLADEPEAAASPETDAGPTPLPGGIDDDELPGLLDIDTGAALDGSAFETASADDAAPLDGFETTDLGQTDTPEIDDFGSVEVTGFDMGGEAEDAGSADDFAIEGLESTMLDFGTAAADLDALDLGTDLERDQGFETFDAGDVDAGDAGADAEQEDDEDAGASFELPTLDEPGDDADDEDFGASFELPTLDDHVVGADQEVDEDEDFGASFELPTLDEEVAGGDEAEEDDADFGTSFELPTFDDHVVGADDEVDEDEDFGASFELPTLGDEVAGGDEAEEDDDDGVFELPEGVFDTPSLDDEEFEDEDLEDEDLDDDVFGQDEQGAVAEWAAEVEDEQDEREQDQAAVAEWAVEDQDEGDQGDEEQDVEEAAEDEEVTEPEPADWSPDMSLPPAPAEPPAAQATERPSRQPVDAESDGFVDLGALLAEDDNEGTRFRVQETAPTGDEDRDFAELLSQFKAKVSEHLPAEDAAAHYDLGLAFKEMGLVDEAIAEFQIALRSGHMRLKVYEELGNCFLQKEQYNIAEKVLRRALEMKYDDELELLGVYYQLGRAYEGLGRRDDARDAYERVLGLDINFQDVTERLAEL